MPTTDEHSTDARQDETPRPGSRAARLAQPTADEIARATAETHGVCTRPIPMRRIDQTTGEFEIVPAPCGSTLESQCGPCAKRARALRIAQCREGWHKTEEPIIPTTQPTEDQQRLLEARADLAAEYRQARDDGADEAALDELRVQVRELDQVLRELGMRGKLPPLDPPDKPAVKRSTRRRQDVPNLPRRPVKNTTIGREYAGKYRPSMFVTLTCDTYGRVHSDGTPVDPESYDYRRAARDAVHFSALVDRWWQNLRRAIGWDAQYFATVEPQHRLAPHLHAAIRGSVPRDLIRQVTAATYHQVWWPAHKRLVYSGGALPVWDEREKGFVDPETRAPLQTWEQALDALDQDPDAEPAHVARFGEQVHIKGILGGSEEAARHIGYLSKYLTKSVGEVIEPDSLRAEAHARRLHAELQVTPCSPRCAVWLLYGIQPKGARQSLTPGHCKGKAHRRATLALPGRRVLVSRKWSGKTLTDHRADRRAFVTERLAEIGIVKPQPEPDRYLWQMPGPHDRDIPPRDQLLMRAVAERVNWRAEYDRAMAAAAERSPDLSATVQAA